MGAAEQTYAVAPLCIGHLSFKMCARAFGLTLVKPAVARVSDDCHRKILYRHHLFKDAVLVESAAVAALSVEEGVVVRGAVGSRKVAVGDVRPSRHVARVGVSVVVHIARSRVDGVSQQSAAPVALLLIQLREIIVFRVSYCRIAVIVMRSNKKLKIIGAV